MSADVLIALAGLMVTVLGALIAGIWQLSGLKTKIEFAVASLQREVEEFKRDRELLDQIPLLKQRIGQLERHLRQRASRPRVRNEDDEEEEQE